MPEGRAVQTVRRGVAGTLAAVCALAAAVAGGAFDQVAPLRFDRDVASVLAGPTLSPAEIDHLETITRRSLEQRPLDGSGWLRLAWLRSLSNPQLDDTANAAILNSYLAEPLGPEITRWRLAFVFDHWRSASPAVRSRALEELTAAYPRRGWDLDSLAPTARDPTGRMIAMVAMSRLRRIENDRRWLADDALGAPDQGRATR